MVGALTVYKVLLSFDNSSSKALIFFPPPHNFHMRQAGVLESEQYANDLADYLVTQGIDVMVDKEADGYAVWVRNEDDFQRAREEFVAFEGDPLHQKYSASRRAAEEIRREKEREQRERAKKYVEFRKRWQQGGMQRRPATVAIIVIAVAIGFATNFFDTRVDKFSQVTGYLTTCHVEIPEAGRVQYPRDIFAQIKEGEVWRLFTPALLHHGVMHMVFNLYWLYALGGMIEEKQGARVLIGLWFLYAIGSGVGSQIVDPQPLMAGMSGAIYGIFGHVWMKSRFNPASGMYLSQNVVWLMLGWFILCVAGVIDLLLGIHVDNWGHGFGLALGILTGYGPVAIHKWQRRG